MIWHFYNMGKKIQKIGYDCYFSLFLSQINFWVLYSAPTSTLWDNTKKQKYTWVKLWCGGGGIDITQ